MVGVHETDGPSRAPSTGLEAELFMPTRITCRRSRVRRGQLIVPTGLVVPSRKNAAVSYADPIRDSPLLCGSIQLLFYAKFVRVYRIYCH